MGEPRVATVTVAESIYAIQVTRADVDTLPEKIQAAFYRNLSREIARKMRGINQWYAKKISEESRHPSESKNA